MRTAVARVAVVSVTAALAVLGVVSPAGAQGGRPFVLELTGEAEVTAAGVPNQGDLDGTGSARLTINPGLGEVCWTYTVSGIDPLTAAHIHIAPPTAPGPVVVPLSLGGGGCTEGVDRELALDIIRDPGAYYVNVHNVPFPAGALRAQLSR